ncbi:MAG: carbamoyl-phosphate synthase large subunit [Robiginitomaculum sp.]|nr:MAG: carbamoyl-phosphate synthase large subunit [Robiginitomaculum sp.]
MQKILIANRSEISIRIAQAASALGITSVAIYSEDDVTALHVHKADIAVALKGSGVSAYLDGAQIIKIARTQKCEAIHPGYGFLSENAAFAKQVEAAGLIFIGPDVHTLETFGDKSRARDLAQTLDVPLLKGTQGSANLQDIEAYFAGLNKGEALIIKAVSGGGGRGMQIVRNANELAEKYRQCCAEALSAVGCADVYAERYIENARHIEVQILGDGTGEVSHVWERDCSLQRRHQKIIEIAPAQNLSPKTREQILAASVAMASHVKYRNIGTFEFLVDDADNYFFMEANPRVQVEHTVTEAVTGLDLVQIQLALAQGKSLKQLGLLQAQIPTPKGIAVQARVNMETMESDGTIKPTGGVLSHYEMPTGNGVRVDGAGYVGLAPSVRFDSLLAKVIVHGSQNDFSRALDQLYRALCEFNIQGIETNLGFLKNILRDENVQQGNFHTHYIDAHAKILTQETHDHPVLFAQGHAEDIKDDVRQNQIVPEGCIAIFAPMVGTIISVSCQTGDMLGTTQDLCIMEAMKMHHSLKPRKAGKIVELCVSVGDTVLENDMLAIIECMDVTETTEASLEIDLSAVRPDLAEIQNRQALTQDAERPDAVAKRRKTNQRTARENITDLCDADSFTEIGSLVVAAQRTRRSLDELIRKTPADGIVTGFGTVNGTQFNANTHCAILHYDYTVMAGTQGMKNHAKTDRMLEIVAKTQRPVIFFTEGGGGRPSDTDVQMVGGLHIKTFSLFAKLSGLVPLVGVCSGYCFAGNAAFLGCCDVIIATENSSIGMGGPAMIEGGGLGLVHPSEVGPIDAQSKNGVVDIRVKDEEAAVKVAKQYLSYFQGELTDWACEDQNILRHVIPENRLQIYDVHTVLNTLADTGSVLELRAEFALGMVTAFARIQGKAVGIIANNPKYLAGAIDKDGADKAARFMQLCDGFDIPLLFLCDTPGIMVGPESEKQGHVRHCTRLFVTGANLDVPFVTIVLRKAYGLGAMAMAGGGFHENLGTVAWPTGEFGGMGLEGAVQLGFRKELQAIKTDTERQIVFNEMVAKLYEIGKALNTASLFEIDDVIDPAQSRKWISATLLSGTRMIKRTHKKRPNIDTF